jgi:hypothetical protein
VGSALTETENWDLLVDCTSRDGRQMLDADHLDLYSQQANPNFLYKNGVFGDRISVH